MKNNRAFIVYLVAFAAFLGPFTQTIYVPIIPEVINELHTSHFLVNLTISFYTLFLAIMQMVYGPLADSKGRRKIMLAGISVYLLATIGCYFSESIYILLIFRSLQAVGIAAGSVIAVTVIGDLFEGNTRIKPMGTFQMMVSLGPVVGPVVGGFLGGSFNFHFVFLALVAVGLLVLAGNFLFLKETKPENAVKRRFKFTDYFTILKNRTGSAIIFLGFIQYYSLYNFLVFLPGLMGDRYGLTVEEKGLVFVPLSLSIVIGSFIGGRLQRFSGKQVVVYTAYLNVAAILLFILVSHVALILLIVSISLFGLFLGMSLPVQTTMLTLEFQANRATATGAYNFFRYMGMAFGPIVGSLLVQMGGYNLLYGFADAAFLGLSLLLSKRFLKGNTFNQTSI
ncbi:MAG: MFS transporter [Bacillota bacterium]|nr:MFS transporter [Bacillota bacterium]MDP4171341.1 MFS transporter [Bacillota bacterium]